MKKEISPQQIEKLKTHKYCCSNSSFLDPLLQKYWCWLIEKVPPHIAPNLITITGLLINIVTSLLLVYYSPYANQEVPRWASFVCCIGLFIYQSLDAIDGKQARRTNSQSPLGELFDHGCDSLSTVFVSVAVCCAVQLGMQPYWLFCQCMMSVTLFYCAHWQIYVSGVMHFSFFDVSEAQFFVMGILLVSSIYGSSWWSQEVPGLDGITLNCLPTVFGCATGSFVLFKKVKTILVERGAGRNGSTVAGTSVLSPVVPLLLFFLPAVLAAWKSSEAVFLSNPVLYMLTFGFLAARVTNRLVVAHMTKHEMAYTDSAMMGPAALVLNQYLNSPVPEHWLLWAVFIYVTYDLLSYCYRVCLELSAALNVPLFTIHPQVGAATPSPSLASRNSRSSAKKGTNP